MDKERDTKNTNVSREKDIYLSNTTDIMIPQIFEQDNGYYYLYKKAERIISAIYIISNFFSDNEPMKWNVRRLGALLLDEIVSLNTSVTDSNRIKNRIILTAQELSSLFSIARVSGAVSDMNFTILEGEFSKLMGVVEALEKNRQNSNPLLFADDFFQISDLKRREKGEEYPREGELIGKKKEGFSLNQAVLNVKNAQRFDRTNDRSEDIVESVLNSQSKHIDNNSYSISKSPIDSRKNDFRKNIILNLIRKNGEINIKNVVSLITDCSEKTIQRELALLVKAGVLKKEGERRWSRYSFA